MGKFIAGVIVALLVLFIGSYIVVHYGFIDISADAPYNKFELFYVNGMLDRWAERFGPKTPNPIQPTDANLIDGVKLYQTYCSVCHGSPQNPIADLGRAQYPHAPQFMKDPPTDMTEGMTYHITRHGVARTGMPAWGKILTDSDIWKLTAFLKRMDNLPPAVDAEWKKGSEPLAPEQGQPGQALPPDVQHQHEHHEH